MRCRERRGGSQFQATKEWGEISARSGQDRLSPARLLRPQWRRPTKARRRADKVTSGSGSGADPASLALEGPEVQIVTLGNSLRDGSLRTPDSTQSCLQNSRKDWMLHKSREDDLY